MPEGRGPQVRHGEVTIPNVPLSEPLALACAHFLACINGDESPLSDGRLGLEVVRVLEAAQASLEMGGATVDLSARVG